MFRGPRADPLKDALDVSSIVLIIDHGITHTTDAIIPTIVRDTPDTRFKLTNTRHTNHGKIGDCNVAGDGASCNAIREVQSLS